MSDNITDEEIAELEKITIEVGEMLYNSDPGKKLDLLLLGSLNTRFQDVLCKSVESDHQAKMLKPSGCQSCGTKLFP